MSKINFGMIKSTIKTSPKPAEQKTSPMPKAPSASQKANALPAQKNSIGVNNSGESQKTTFLESHAKQLGFSYVPFWLKEMHDNLKPANLVFR